jgi:hypothetical protein
MTILQRYLASIGVISLSNTRSGKYPSLGSGYPSSSSSQFFHAHSAQMAAAAAAAAGTRSAGHAAGSPSPSNQYDMYDEEQQEAEQQLLQQQQQEYEHLLAYQQHAAAAAAAECDEEHQQHYGQQFGYEQQYSEHTAAAAPTGDADCEGAAAGLLQLARAALMHLEEEEDEEGNASAGIKQEADDADMQEDAAGSGLERAQAQLPQLRASSSRQSGRHAAGAPWGKPELLPVVRSNSEDSDHTAEEEEGSPMAEANLKLQLQQALRPSSSSLAKGKRSPQGGNGLAGSSMPGSKRHRPMWQHPASTAAGTAAPPRLRPVLDVSSEPAGSSYGGTHSPAAGEHSPASPAARGSSSPAAAGGSGMLGQAEPHARLLALMMQAFMGAAAAGAASSSAEGQLPAAALSANHLAAVARIMQISGLAAGPAAAAAAGSPSSSAAAGSNSAVADMLAAMMQGDAAAGGAHAVAAWSSTLEQHVRAAAGQ